MLKIVVLISNHNDGEISMIILQWFLKKYIWIIIICTCRSLLFSVSPVVTGDTNWKKSQLFNPYQTIIHHQFIP